MSTEKTGSEQMVATNMGNMPIEDYREIVAMQHGFDSYADMRSQGVYIGKGMDANNSEREESVRERLLQKPKTPAAEEKLTDRRKHRVRREEAR